MQPLAGWGREGVRARVRAREFPRGNREAEGERRSPTSLHQEREIHLFTFCKHLKRFSPFGSKRGRRRPRSSATTSTSGCSAQELECPAGGLPCQLRGVVVPAGAIGAPGTAAPVSRTLLGPALHRKTLSLGPKGGVGLWCRCEVARAATTPRCTLAARVLPRSFAAVCQTSTEGCNVPAQVTRRKPPKLLF